MAGLLASLQITKPFSMKLEKKFLQSKVARRMLLFFFLSAFIPILFLALLAYSESNKMLANQTHSRLDAISDNYNHFILDRLILADQLLTDVAQQSSTHDQLISSKQSLSSRFT